MAYSRGCASLEQGGVSEGGEGAGSAGAGEESEEGSGLLLSSAADGPGLLAHEIRFPGGDSTSDIWY